MSEKFGLIVGGIVGAVVIGGLMYYAFAPVETESGAETERREKVASKSGGEIAEVRPSRSASSSSTVASKEKKQKKSKQRTRMAAPKDWYEKLPPKDRAIATRIQEAQDADDSAAVLSAAEEALNSDSDEVRQAAVDALSLQGEVAIPLLMNFLADKNAGVSDSAYHAWDDAVDGVEGDMGKLAAIKQVIDVDKNKEHIASAVGKIEMLDKPRAIRELAKLAEENGPAAEAAIESYENLMGEPFESWAAAELKAIVIEKDNTDE